MRLANESITQRYVDFESHCFPAAVSTSVRPFAFRELVEPRVRSLISLLNTWRYTQLSLESWARTLRGRPEAEKAQLLFEFVEPLAERAIDMPYRAKQAMIFLGYKALAQRRPHESQVEDEAVGFKPLDVLAKRDKRSKTFLAALKLLDTPELRASTQNFRVLRHHRFAPGIEMGILPTVVTSKARGGLSFGFGVLEPLSLDNLCAALDPEHQRAVICFESLWRLASKLHADLRAGP